MHICPKCGAPEGSKSFIGPFCADCYTFKIRMPERLEARQCKRCKSILISGKWIKYSEKALKEWIGRRIKGEFSSMEIHLPEKEVVFQVEREGSSRELKKALDFELVNDICPECNKKAGGYFEAIIQLRGNPERTAKYMRIFDKGLAEHGSFLGKIVEDKNGLDLYAGSTRAVLAIVKELRMEHKISTKLAGQKEGKRIYRTTFSIRL